MPYVEPLSDATCLREALWRRQGTPLADFFRILLDAGRAVKSQQIGLYGEGAVKSTRRGPQDGAALPLVEAGKMIVETHGLTAIIPLVSLVEPAEAPVANSSTA